MSPPKPKVLLISTVHPPNDPRIVFKVAASLQNHYDVTCALPNATPETLAGVQFIKLPFYPKLTDRLWRVHPLVIWKLLETKPDVVQVFVAELLPIAFIFSWFGAKIIYEVQENLPKKFHTKKINNEKLFQYFFRCFDGLARRFFYLVFTEYAYLKDYSNLKKPHRVVANFASLPLLNPMWQPYRAGNNSQPAEFLYVGVVSTDRCIQTMIDALALVRVSHPDVIMHLFGTVNFGMENLEKLGNYELVRKNMVFHGYTDLRVAYQKARTAVAGIAMLKAVGDYPDSYTTKMFDYMALGLPVLTSNFELYRSVIETADCGFCLPPNDPNALAESMNWLIANPLGAQKMGENGRAAVEKNYNWASEEQKLLALYREVTSS